MKDIINKSIDFRVALKTLPQKELEDMIIANINKCLSFILLNTLLII